MPAVSPTCLQLVFASGSADAAGGFASGFVDSFPAVLPMELPAGVLQSCRLAVGDLADVFASGFPAVLLMELSAALPTTLKSDFQWLFDGSKDGLASARLSQTSRCGLSGDLVDGFAGNRSRSIAPHTPLPPHARCPFRLFRVASYALPHARCLMRCGNATRPSISHRRAVAPCPPICACWENVPISALNRAFFQSARNNGGVERSCFRRKAELHL